MILLISVFFSIIPILAYLVLLKKGDKFDRFPFSILLICVLWGAVGSALLTFAAGSIIYKISFNNDYLQLVHYSENVFFPPVLEEFTKGIFLFFIMSNKMCHNKTDGMAYGGAIGFGFSTTENFLYYLTYGSNFNNLVFLIIVRTFFVAIMHYTATASLGISIGIAKSYNGLKRIYIPIAGFVFSVLLHTAWNSVISFYDAALWGFISMIIIAAVFIFVYILSVHNDRKMIVSTLMDEVSNGFLSVENIELFNKPVSSFRGRTDRYSQRVYLRTAVSLVFNKIHYANSGKAGKNLFEKEIANNRIFLQRIVNKGIISDE
jgi:RsiW-degrading membrane proteinase PrsW (M82 family)